MTRFRAIAVLLLAAVAALVAPLQRQSRVYAFHYEQVLGTSFDLKVVARSPALAERGAVAALAEIARESRILSAYDRESEFSRWVRTTGIAVPVSPELFEVLSLFDVWRARTAGAINPAAEAATRLWKDAASERRVPDPAELAVAAAAIQQLHWALDPVHRSATHLTSVPLVLHSFTKSYIAERAARAALESSGGRAVVVDIGGDLVIRGDWTEEVGIADPGSGADNGRRLATMAIRNRAVATSGGYRRGVDIDGHHYSHIIDPRTARPAGHVLSATVVAPDAATAGALATAFCVLTPEESRGVAASIPGVEFMLVERDGGRVESAAWRTLEVDDQTDGFHALPTVFAAEQGMWDPAFELTISLDVARIDGFGSRRPYVAVWIEDKDRFPVRTLALWFQKPRWLADLKSWYRGDRMRAMAEGSELVSSVSSATRSPGRYTLKWDGRDNQGKPVKAGTYTVYIEAAREHGTYQLMHQAMECSGVARHVELAANVEIAAAALDYHKLGGR